MSANGRRTDSRVGRHHAYSPQATQDDRLFTDGFASVSRANAGNPRSNWRSGALFSVMSGPSLAGFEHTYNPKRAWESGEYRRPVPIR